MLYKKVHRQYLRDVIVPGNILRDRVMKIIYFKVETKPYIKIDEWGNSVILAELTKLHNLSTHHQSFYFDYSSPSGPGNFAKSGNYYVIAKSGILNYEFVDKK